MKFIHTADWQIGKPFAGIRDEEKRTLVRQERIEAIKRIGSLVREHGAEFVVVAGDLFDSPSPSKAVVSAACGAIGEIEVPVVVIPGNHDHAGPGGVWEQDFFCREQSSLAPNLQVALKFEPIILASATIFPCPLLRRAESSDTTAWLRDGAVLSGRTHNSPRIILAHGSTQSFAALSDESEDVARASNLVSLDGLADSEYDYLALGDWHGAKQVGAKAWYSGTPELDRFPKGEEHEQGYILLVNVWRGSIPSVEKLRTARLRWSEEVFDLSGDASVDTLKQRLAQLTGGRTREDLLRLRLTGSLGIVASNELQHLIQTLEARLLRLRLDYGVTVAPTEDEMLDLTTRASDPLISSVARKLVERAQVSGDSGELSRIALRELHAAVHASNQSS